MFNEEWDHLHRFDHEWSSDIHLFLHLEWLITGPRFHNQGDLKEFMQVNEGYIKKKIVPCYKKVSRYMVMTVFVW